MFNLGKLQEVYNRLQNKVLWILLQWQSAATYVINFTIFFIINIFKIQLLPNLMTPWHRSFQITHTYDRATVNKPPSWSMQCACLLVRASGMDAIPIWRCVWYIDCSMLEVIKKNPFKVLLNLDTASGHSRWFTSKCGTALSAFWYHVLYSLFFYFGSIESSTCR
jgi:hypothetical protein